MRQSMLAEKREYIRKVYEWRIPPLYRKARWTHLHKALRQAIRQADETQGILLWGSPGVGKSYTAAAMLRMAIAQGKNPIRITYEQFCLDIRSTYSPGSTRTENMVIKPLLDCGVLFLEDVGTTKSIGGKESDFSLRSLLVILDHRLEHCKRTVITTNKNVSNLAKSFDERIGSRLSTFKVIHMNGRDRRGGR